MIPVIHVKLAEAENIVFLANMPLIDVHASGIFQFRGITRLNSLTFNIDINEIFTIFIFPRNILQNVQFCRLCCQAGRKWLAIRLM